jgi:signal transduction histidine kinase
VRSSRSHSPVAERLSIGAASAVAAYFLAAAVAGLPRLDILLVPLIAIAYACGRYARTLPGAGCCVAIVVTAVLAGGDTVVPFVLVTAAPWFAGFAVRGRQEMLDSLDSRTRELEAEQDTLARLSVQRERARIARELHDIVAHHLAVIVVQAGAGRMAGGEEPEAAERFARIRQSGEQALSEMEHLVDLLQASDDEDARRIDVLLDQAQAAGLKLSASPLPPELSLPPEAERLAYRVVQEGLTNAMKHAPGSEVRLRLSASAGELEIVLENWGGEGSSALAGTGSGLGLRGLRERLESLGGTLEAAPSGGGWRLRADIPLT